MDTRKPYPTDVSDEEWGCVAPNLTLIDEHAPQRHHELRELFNALRWLVCAGAPWRLLPTNFPPWPVVYQQTQRWLHAGCFEAIVNDLRSILRAAQLRVGQPLSSLGTRLRTPAADTRRDSLRCVVGASFLTTV